MTQQSTNIRTKQTQIWTCYEYSYLKLWWLKTTYECAIKYSTYHFRWFHCSCNKLEFEVSAREPCFYRYTYQILYQVISIFHSSIVRQADIYSYSVIVTFTTVGLTIAFKVDDDDNNDDDNAFKYRDYEQLWWSMLWVYNWITTIMIIMLK